MQLLLEQLILHLPKYSWEIKDYEYGNNEQFIVGKEGYVTIIINYNNLDYTTYDFKIYVQESTRRLAFEIKDIDELIKSIKDKLNSLAVFFEKIVEDLK